VEPRINAAKIAPGIIEAMLGISSYIRKSGLLEEDVTDSAKRKMLLDNSLRFYGMEKAAVGRRGAAVSRPEPAEARRNIMPGTISARDN
jgi:hypothetical protein